MEKKSVKKGQNQSNLFKFNLFMVGQIVHTSLHFPFVKQHLQAGGWVGYVGRQIKRYQIENKRLTFLAASGKRVSADHIQMDTLGR